MFWKYNHQSSPHIDTLLNKDDVTLQELMDEEDVLNECKIQNKKLIDFLVRPEVMEELVRLATVEPGADTDERQRYKYPNIACELLTCDVPTLNERLAGDDELLGKLYTFLEADSPLNPLLASFFSKTFGVLVARKSEQNWYSYQFTCLQVLEFLKSKENFITLLLKHLGTSAIMDLLLKLITHIEGAELKQNILNWLDCQQVIQCLVGLLDPKVDSERNCNAAQLLCDVIKTARENQHNSQEKCEPDPILNRVEDPETVSQLLSHMLGPERHESSIVGGVTVLLTLLDCSRPSREPATDPAGNSLYCNEGHNDEPTPGEAEQASRVVQSTLEALLPRLGDFHSLLVDPPHKPAVKTTAGLLDPPLGNTRLHVARLLAALVAAHHPRVDRELATLGTLGTLLDLFFAYSWNNFLHSQVELCLAHALAAEPVGGEGDGEGDEESNMLLKNIFIKCRLLQRILEAWEDNENQQSKSGGLRRGYMGHLIKIANVVATQMEKGSLGSFVAEHVPAETVAAWEAFTASTLAETNKTHAINLGGSHPVHSSSEDDDPEYRDIPFPQDTALQQAFSDFQMQQMAPQFIESYGFNDDEFIDGDDILHTSVDVLTSMTFSLSDAELDKQTDMFTKVCAGKMRSVPGTEDDVWEDEEQPFPNTRNRSWEEGGEDTANSSDEEEEREGPEGSEEIQMEVDTTDPWPAVGSSSGGSPGLIAEDSANPWSSAAATSSAISSAAPAANDQGGWADFGSGGFADFESNFSASPVAAATADSPAAASRAATPPPLADARREPTDASPAMPCLPTPGDNASPSSCVDPLTAGNQRFDVIQKAAVGDQTNPSTVRHPKADEVTENGPLALEPTVVAETPSTTAPVGKPDIPQSPVKSKLIEESANVSPPQ